MQKFCTLICVFFCLQANAQNLNIDSLQRLLVSAPADTNRVILYRMLAGLIKNQDPGAARTYAKSGVELAHQLKYEKGLAGCYLNLAAAYISLGHLDSALQYQDTAITVSKRVGEPNRLALAYLNRADIYMQLRLFREALIDCDSSLHYANIVNSDDRRGRVYQTLGSIHYHQEQYNEAIPYYEKAYQLYLKAGNLQMSSIALNNSGNAYKHVRNYEEALKRFQQLISQADSSKDRVNMSMYYANISDLYLEMNRPDLARPYSLKALAAANEQNIPRLLIHANQGLAAIAMHTKDYNAATPYAEAAWLMASDAGDLPLKESTASMLAEIYEYTGKHTEGLKYLRISRDLKDSLAKQQFTQDIASMQTRFHVADKDREIQLLAKDAALSEERLYAQRNLLIGSIALIILAITSIVLLINRNRLRQRMKELELRDRIAADLHDDVGSSLSSISLLSQMASNSATTPETQLSIMSKVSTNAQETMEKMSDIVWMIKPGENEHSSLESRMRRFLSDITEAKGIAYELHTKNTGQMQLTMTQRRNIYLIFKEAVNNAVKYSESKKIDVYLNCEHGFLNFAVLDHGKGFDSNTTRMGNGLLNMEQRAEELGATFTCIDQSGLGTQIMVSFQVKVT